LTGDASDEPKAEKEATATRIDQNVVFAELQREASYRAKKLSLERISTVRNDREIHFGDLHSMNTWFESRQAYYLDRYAQQLSKDLGLGLQETYFSSLCTHLEVDTGRRARLERRFFQQTWRRERGHIFEWFVFLALARRPVDGYKLKVLELLPANVGKKNALPVLIGKSPAPVYLWYQASYQEPRLNTELRPDFSLTRNSETPGPANLVSTIECKSVRALSTGELREVWARRMLLSLR